MAPQSKYPEENFKVPASEWKSFAPSELSGGSRYSLCISAVVPRPVAVITSIGANGVVNCAPFSYTSISSHDPPIVTHGLCLSGGAKKDTLRNIEENEEWVFNVLTKGYLEKANECSAPLPPEESELERAELTVLQSDIVAPPRVAESAVSMECKLFDKKEIFNDDGVHTTTIVMGRVVKFHILEAVLKEGRAEDSPVVDLERVEMVGRAGDITYWPLGVQEGGKKAMVRPKK